MTIGGQSINVYRSTTVQTQWVACEVSGEFLTCSKVVGILLQFSIVKGCIFKTVAPLCCSKMALLINPGGRWFFFAIWHTQENQKHFAEMLHTCDGLSSFAVARDVRGFDGIENGNSDLQG